MSMVDQSDTERAVTERINPGTMSAVQLSQNHGGLGFSNMAEAMQFAKVMAISGIAVPPHCRGNVGVCMAITIQAVEWKMSPFAVANKSYEVNGRLGYESQLIQAVILQRAPIKGRFRVEFSGEGTKRQCTVTATLKEGDEKAYISPEIGNIKVQNSPLWKSDPDQQLSYYAGRALCRRHFPDVLLGIYTPEELYDAGEPWRGPEQARDVTPKKTLPEQLDTLAAAGSGANSEPAPDEEAEIISDEMAARAQAITVEANAGTAGTTNPRLDPAAVLAQHLEEQAEAKALGLHKEPGLDLGTQQLLDDGRKVANKGAREFQIWHRRLSQKHADQIAPYLEELRAKANGADTAREGA